VFTVLVNPLDSKGNYSATSNNTKLVHWPSMDAPLSLVQLGGAWAVCGPLPAVPNVTAHPSTASVPITVFLYDDPLLYGLHVAIKGLTTVKKFDRKASISDTQIPYHIVNTKFCNRALSRCSVIRLLINAIVLLVNVNVNVNLYSASSQKTPLMRCECD